METEAFKPENWELIICEDLDKKYICDRCKHEIYGDEIGYTVYCLNCHKYVWKIKNEKCVQNKTKEQNTNA